MLQTDFPPYLVFILFSHLFSVLSSPSVFLPGTPPAAATLLLSDPDDSSSLQKKRKGRRKGEESTDIDEEGESRCPKGQSRCPKGHQQFRRMFKVLYVYMCSDPPTERGREMGTEREMIMKTRTRCPNGDLGHDVADLFSLSLSPVCSAVQIVPRIHRASRGTSIDCRPAGKSKSGALRIPRYCCCAMPTTAGDNASTDAFSPRTNPKPISML